MSKALASICESAAAEVLRLRSALGTACRYGTDSDIESARTALKQARVVRLRADADYLESDLPPSRTLNLAIADLDPNVSVTSVNHALIEQSQREAITEFCANHPRDPEDGWDRQTLRLYSILLKSNLSKHVAIGCSPLDPCRRLG